MLLSSIERAKLDDLGDDLCWEPDETTTTGRIMLGMKLLDYIDTPDDVYDVNPEAAQLFKEVGDANNRGIFDALSAAQQKRFAGIVAFAPEILG